MTGIGREFALQLASLKFNILIMARTESKLETVATEAKELYKVQTIVHPFDFSKASDSDYAALKKVVEKLDVRVLVNNVAMNHAFPIPFLEEDESIINNIVEVNIASLLKVTRLVTPRY
jgi:17beta-estradiol 17-dehydrogenase / very-long-chain 3-oxoacyl-CoA reductase